VGILEKSSYTLSVQFLNRVTYVQDLVRERDLLGCLGQSLLETLSVAKVVAGGRMEDVVGGRVNPVLNSTHIVLSNRRYSPCISDLKCVLNVPGMGRLFSSVPSSSSSSPKGNGGRCSLDAWVESLSLGQNMDGQEWRCATRNHVETEPKGWVGAFNASISLGSLFERLLNWEDDDEVSITDNPKTSIHSSTLFTAVDLTHYVLTNGLTTWQEREMTHRPSTFPPSTSSPSSSLPLLPPHHIPTTKGPRTPELCRTASLPMSTVAVEHGTYLAMRAVPVAQGDSWSFHLPLHRFAAACLREVARRPTSTSASTSMGGLDEDQVKAEGGLCIEDLLQKLMPNDDDGDDGEEAVYRLFQGLMEFPVIVLSRAAQIRSGLWRRNGPGMLDQVLNYAEPPFCRTLRDADLTLVQFSLLGFNHLASHYHTKYDNDSDINEDDSTSPQPSNNNNDVGCAQFINLLLNRLGIFDFTGLTPAPSTNPSRYQSEITHNLYSPEKENPQSISSLPTTTTTLPWTYTITDDITASLSLFEEFLYTLIVVITELPPPPAMNMIDHTRQAKERLKREVVHRLVSGSKTHSELAEVHHVLPLRDNAVLSEEGKLVNPDDASGAALEAALQEVAERRSTRGRLARLAPDKWELRRNAWEDYDPAFFHISSRNHQNAAENRPKRGMGSADGKTKEGDGAVAVAYAPCPPAAHESFRRLRRDITSDATVLALLYRTLHVHCRSVDSSADKDMAGVRGSAAYKTTAKSETVLARAIHLLTLGAYAWDTTSPPTTPATTTTFWNKNGGGTTGSIFHTFQTQPLPSDWITNFLLAEPHHLMNSLHYAKEESALLLLHRLAHSGDDGVGGEDKSTTPTFCAQDVSIRNGARWLCEYAKTRDEGAELVLGREMAKKGRAARGMEGGDGGGRPVGETDLKRRSRIAREREMKRVQERMANFAKMFEEVEEGDDGEKGEDDDTVERVVKPILVESENTLLHSPVTTTTTNITTETTTTTRPMVEDSASLTTSLESDGSALPLPPIRQPSPGAIDSITLDDDVTMTRPASASSTSSSSQHETPTPATHIQPPAHRRILLTSELRCVICGDGDCIPTTSPPSSHSKNPDHKTDNERRRHAKSKFHDHHRSHHHHTSSTSNLTKSPPEKILAFCGYAQASTILRGGGGAPTTPSTTSYNPLTDLVGTHVSLCGHVMHTSCCEAHIKDLTSRVVSERFTDRVEGGKRGDFQCPMCRQLSNCLIPVIGVGSDWIRRRDDVSSVGGIGGEDDEIIHQHSKPSSLLSSPSSSSLESFLSTTKWWATRNDKTIQWNGRSAFFRKGIKSPPFIGKKDLYIAWMSVMRSRKRKGSPESMSSSSSSPPKQGSLPLAQAHGGVAEVLPPTLPSRCSVGSVGSIESESGGGSSSSLSIQQRQEEHTTMMTPSSSSSHAHHHHQQQHISVVIDVWRRVMDQFADVSYKADSKRLGESRLQRDYGEFRHYLVEKVVYNEENRSVGKEIVDWPECIMQHINNRRQELSRERLLSKLLQSIQSFTYSCAAEEVECKRLGKKAASLDDTSNPLLSDILSKYGVHKFTFGGRFLILSALEGNDDVEGGVSQYVFGGRIGRLRYLGLAIMAATGVVSNEIIQLTLDLPTTATTAHAAQHNNENNSSSSTAGNAVLDPEVSDSSMKTDDNNRAPLVFPILCGHILTHVVAAMCAACGQERAESNSASFGSSLPSTSLSDNNMHGGSGSGIFGGAWNVVDDCERFIQLGFLARVLQVLLGSFQDAEDGMVYDARYSIECELKVVGVISRLGETKDDGQLSNDMTSWEMGCYRLLHAALQNTTESSMEPSSSHRKHDNGDMDIFFAACKTARGAAYSFLCNIGLILQVLAPSRVSTFIDASTQRDGGDSSLESLMSFVGIVTLEDCMESTLARSIIVHWYKRARPDDGQRTDRARQLNCISNFTVNDWPLVEHWDNAIPDECDAKPASLLPNVKKYIPLLGGNVMGGDRSRLNRPHIKALPISYTDLYAELTSLLPDSELTAVCLVCGEVLDAGKGLCTKHGFECGGGSGIFFLLQDCIGLILHKEKAAYVHSPYVDSHGETPQYRGKRLNLELSRYNILRELWCGHMLRQEVISERSNVRAFLPNNLF